MTKKELNNKITVLNNAFSMYLESQKKFLLREQELRDRIDDRFNNQIESLKGEVRRLKRLREDDLELITNLALNKKNK